MSNIETKTCSITEDEIKMLIMEIGRELTEENIDTTLDRMNYLNRRLKAEKKEVEIKPVPTITYAKSDAINQAAAANPASW